MVNEVLQCRLPRVASCRLRLSRAGWRPSSTVPMIGCFMLCSESDEREAVSTLI